MENVHVNGVDVARWNPQKPYRWARPRRAFRWTRKLPLAPRVNNVGDLAGVDVIRHLAAEHQRLHRSQQPVLGAIGSIIHMLPDGAHVWGPGVNGKHLDLQLPRDLEVHAVRGPRTRDYLLQRGVNAPAIYGDPGLLIPLLPQFSTTPVKDRELTVVPNLNDTALASHPQATSPIADLARFVDTIRRSDLVVASSLHALIFADAFGVPARAIATSAEPEFKYLDYYEGTGRRDVHIASSVEDAVRLGGAPPLEWDSGPLLDAFPYSLWNSANQEPTR